jgi:hypothetical protein
MGIGTLPNLVRCARCGHSCDVEAWRSTPAERTITRDDLVDCVRPWPTGAIVEVRRCAGCGSHVARSRRAA